MQIKVSIILLRSEKSVATGAEYLLKYDLGRQTAVRERGVEREGGREGKREAESESIRLTKKKVTETQRPLDFSILSICIKYRTAGL